MYMSQRNKGVPDIAFWHALIIYYVCLRQFARRVMISFSNR